MKNNFYLFIVASLTVLMVALGLLGTNVLNKLIDVKMEVTEKFEVIQNSPQLNKASANQTLDEENGCYTIYDENGNILFMKGEGVLVKDEYISSDNKLYIIEEVDEENLTGVAKYKEDVEMPVYNIKKNYDGVTSVSAQRVKKIGLYHTHNDECYDLSDGTDSIYGAGGIHDVGKRFKKNFEELNINVYYSENLHLPHNSGAYTRSEQTASELLKNGLDAIFDIHRDATPRSEYFTTVNGEAMSKVRIVIGQANTNSEINKEFALNIKAYADTVYPGLIKDIYIGKGNYNQQLSPRALLFEMGTNLIEKELVYNSIKPLTRTIDVVLYGTTEASSKSLSDFDVLASSGSNLELGMVGNSTQSTPATDKTLWIVLGSIGGVALIVGLLVAFSQKFRHWIKRLFSEMFAIFKKKPR